MHPYGPQVTLAVDSHHVVPIYIVVDQSWAVNEALQVVNARLIPTLIQSCARHPLIDELFRFCIIGFSDHARVVSPLIKGTQLAPYLFEASSGSSFSEMFTLLRSQLEIDCRALKVDGRKPYRPQVFLLADGEPLDQPGPAFARLIDGDFGYSPHLSIFALDPDAPAWTLEAFVAGRQGRAFRRKGSAGMNESVNEFIEFIQDLLAFKFQNQSDLDSGSWLKSWEALTNCQRPPH